MSDESPDQLPVHPSQTGGAVARSPRRILFVSANMGAGHNATARAVEQSAHRLWPEADVRHVDTLDVMGPGVGPVFRQIYVTNVQTTPWLYEYFYDSLWRHRWFASASKRFTGAWCGRRLARVVDNYQPDLIVSTYPLGSSGLQWLRRRGELDVPVAAWVSDFAPHPFWVYPDLDVHFVMHDACVGQARVAEPDAAVRVAAPPVADAFAPADRAVARDKLGLDQSKFLAVLSCGYFGFGTVETAVDTLLDIDPRVQVVAVCGHNEQLRRRLAARGEPAERLLVLGWVEDMPTYVSAADVMVTNAGGATSLEAMACGRAVLMFEPIAAHGRANAELMAEAGLALLCRGPRQLRDTVRGLLNEPGRLADIERAALAHTESHTREDDLRLVTGGGRPALSGDADHDRQPRGAVRGNDRAAVRLRPMHAEDAFFLYTDTPSVTQLIGGVVYTERPIELEEAVAGIGERVESLPNLRRRLVAGRSRWRRPAWLLEDAIDVRQHVRERVLGADGEPATFGELVDDFFSTPLDMRKPLWEAHLVRDPAGSQSGLVVKMHHALGDGFAAIDSMAGLLDEAAGSESRTRRSVETAARLSDGSRDSRKSRRRRPLSSASAPHDGDGADRTTDPASKQAAGTLTQAGQRTKRVVTGTYQLARGGMAPKTPLNGPMAQGQRRHGLLSLPVPEVRATARGLGSDTNSLLLALVVDGLARLLDKRGEPTAGTSVRMMIPRTIRTLETRHALGNITAAIPVDMPLGPMSPQARLADVRDRMGRQLKSGQPEATRVLIKSMGVLPAPLHARLARGAYRSRWFNAIVSVIPGPRRAQHFHGNQLTEVYPILPMAEGVGLAVGLMRWADAFSIGLTGDAGLLDDVDTLAEAVREAFNDYRDAAPTEPARE